ARREDRRAQAGGVAEEGRGALLQGRPARVPQDDRLRDPEEEARQLQRQGRDEPGGQLPQDRRHPHEDGLRPSALRNEEGPLDRAARPRQHGDGLPGRERQLPRPALRPPRRQKDFMIITPTIDKEFGPGGASSVSDVKDNVHWFEALTDSAFVFNIHVNGLKTNPKSPGRVYVDPNGEKIEGGKIRARVLDHDETKKLYGELAAGEPLSIS